MTRRRLTYTRCCASFASTPALRAEPAGSEGTAGEQAERPGRGDPDLPDRAGEPDRWPPRTQSGRRRAHPGHPSGLRFPRRPDRLRHRAPELRAQDHHRPPGPVPDAAAARRSLRLSESAESEHDWVENSHASTALSYAAGLASGLQRTGRSGTVVALVGDGSLTGGMAWEALNNIAADDDLPLVIVVNDNGRSYTPTVGGLARHLTGLRTNPAVRAAARPGQARRGQGAAGRRGGVRPAARHQDRAQGRGGPAEHVLRPRAEVRRPDRRPRRARRRAGAAARPSSSAARCWCTA